MMVTKFGGKQWDPASMAVAKVARNHGRGIGQLLAPGDQVA